MSKWSSSAAIALAFTLGDAGWAQMASRNQKIDILRVGSRIACQCGCSDTVATCSMYGCWSHQAKQKIADMQATGSSDSTIIDDFKRAYGKDIYRGEPNTFGWMIPYLVLVLGAAVIVWYLRRARWPRLPRLTDPRLTHYQEQIEKELQNLDR